MRWGCHAGEAHRLITIMSSARSRQVKLLLFEYALLSDLDRAQPLVEHPHQIPGDRDRQRSSNNSLRDRQQGSGQPVTNAALGRDLPLR